ncbi:MULTISPECIES: TonB-dependent receptor [unclassified Variovorax]|uniref:TonB-dependent receptor n=1 Tax=unclassified Variovorax TaxID=663243 RepID=UPI000D11DEC5|nr:MULTISPECIES: TonB-dependent receptor [unclassified Variovorax]AVQ85098.1 TonB-dependent receptor [Variovorax sp. PMC12]QRY34720.1 TonB-dependent receptor [Variovorax sp. PDNC026]
MNKTLLSLALGAAFPWLAVPAFAQGAAAAEAAADNVDNTPERTKSLGVVTVTGGQPTSLPTQIPTTIEGVTREEIETRINATDSEDALKYLPSLLVRKRYIGDYNHAILSTRASGTGNSARSAVYADGILLSNYLGNGIANGTNFAPRWGLVTPEEIERVDVMYGPFSAAYPGNSAGAVVDYVTRMPTQLEAHVKVGYSSQPNNLYSTRQTFNSWQTSASLGSRSGDWSWWIDINRTDSEGQPLTFTTATLASGTPGRAGTPVYGALGGLNTTNTPWYILGTGTQYHTLQDHAKLKLAYDFSPTVRATYTLGWWQNTANGQSASYLTNAQGQPVYSGPVNINGRSFNLAPTAFPLTADSATHYMHGLSVKSNTQGVFDWELAASLYDYSKDTQRAPTTALPLAAYGGAGTLQDQGGTGWNTLAAKGSWRPQGAGGAHIVDFGVGRDAYKLGIVKTNVLGNWQDGAAFTPVSNVGGRTETYSAWAQDAWSFAPKWKAVLGLRYEHWEAKDGFTATAATAQSYASRSESDVSPKAALAYQLTKDTVLKASVGRAVRYPTVGELYGATSGGALSFINDPTLKPEKSWTGELSAEKDLGNGLLRATLFHETTKNALYSQLIPNSTVSRVQNIDKVRTTGVEIAYTGQNVLIKGLDLGASLTYADSKTVADAAFPAAVGKWQPRVPRWRSTVYATYKPDARWSFTAAARYSGRQYSNLDNSDVNAFAYFGASKYFTVDFRVRYQIDKQWSAAFGIDNANNYQYWNFHPYPQRTYTAELRFDL